MLHDLITKPDWADLEGVDITFDWMEAVRDEDGELEATLHYRDAGQEHYHYPRDLETYTAWEVAGVSVTERGLTQYFDRERVIEIMGYAWVSDMDERETERMEAA